MVHSCLNHENIIKLYSYLETEKEYILLLEYADKESFLSEKVENVTFPGEHNSQRVPSRTKKSCGLLRRTYLEVYPISIA